MAPTMPRRLRAGLLLLCALLIVASAEGSRAQRLNVRVSDPSQVQPDPEEVSIALDPTDHGHLAVGANITYLYTSSDSGMTWAMKEMSSRYGFWGDPVLLYDDSGMLYYEHLSGQNWQDPEFLFRIVIQRSADHGITFDSGEQTGYAPPTMQDKAWLSLDRSPTASRGSILTSWNEDDKYGSTAPGDSDRIFFSRTTDRGATWSERTRVDDRGGDCLDSSNTLEGATTAVTKNGEICIAWCGRDTIYFDRSLDGGRTFGHDRAIELQPGGWNFKVPGIFRANGFPMLSSDMNPSSPFYGRLYIMWSDQRRGVTDVYTMHSDDAGLSWSKRQRVNTDSSLQHHFFPSMTVDPVTGHLFIVYYDRRAYQDARTDVYLATSVDGGVSFHDERISESAFTPADSIFFGDYIGISAHDRHVHPVWMRLDVDPQNGRPHTSVWTTSIQDTFGLAHASVASGTTTQVKDDAVRVDGVGLSAGINVSIAHGGSVMLDLRDVLGRRLRTLLAGEYGAGEYRIGLPAGLAPGTYLVRLEVSPTGAASAAFSTHVAKFVVTP